MFLCYYFPQSPNLSKWFTRTSETTPEEEDLTESATNALCSFKTPFLNNHCIPLLLVTFPFWLSLLQHLVLGSLGSTRMDSAFIHEKALQHSLPCAGCDRDLSQLFPGKGDKSAVEGRGSTCNKAADPGIQSYLWEDSVKTNITH